MKNLFTDVPDSGAGEAYETIVNGEDCRVERIISRGTSSPDGFWYDQAESEWVAVLQGEAKLLFEGDATPVHLREGDHLTIPAHRKHRIEWTLPTTIWLAVFFAD